MNANNFNALADLEPTAKKIYCEAITSDGQVPSLMGRFHQGMLSLAVENPTLSLDQRWEELKRVYPKLFWEFVLQIGSSNPQRVEARAAGATFQQLRG